MAGTSENLVIGGGLAGPMVAMRLAAAGREVVLLERERTSHHKVCGEFLSPEAVKYLRGVGVDPISLGAVAIRKVRLSAGQRIIETDLPFTALSLSRCVLDEALLARAEAHGCAVRRGCPVEKLSPRGNQWVAEMPGVASCRAQSVFLATGKHDLRGWARKPGLQNDLVGFKMHWRLAPGEADQLRNAMELFLFSGGYGGLALVEDGVANLCFVVRRAVLHKHSAWRELLHAITCDSDLMRQRLHGAQAVWDRPYAISSIPYGLMRMETSGLWCVGDQAAVIPSFTGDGMSIALHSGALAAAMFLNGNDPIAYQRELRTQLRTGMTLATTLSRAMVTRLGGSLAPAALSVYPQVLGWIAAATRIPESALAAG